MVDRSLFLVLIVIELLCVAGMFALQYAFVRVRRERQQSVRGPIAAVLDIGTIGLAASAAMFFLASRS